MLLSGKKESDRDHTRSKITNGTQIQKDGWRIKLVMLDRVTDTINLNQLIRSSEIKTRVVACAQYFDRKDEKTSWQYILSFGNSPKSNLND